MTAPADLSWTMGRIAALLSGYYDKATPLGIREIEAEDWAEALRDYPQWAIERACRWWKSVDNSKRGKRPVEGDIVARVRKEMDPVLAAKRRLGAGKSVSMKSSMRIQEIPSVPKGTSA